MAVLIFVIYEWDAHMDTGSAYTAGTIIHSLWKTGFDLAVDMFGDAIVTGIHDWIMSGARL